jgi:hypothetical protein
MAGVGEMSSSSGRAEVTQEAMASAEAVWSVLADGWMYATWVVGACRIRAVDENWPAPGTQIHHSVGAWPVLINDTSTVLKSDPARDLVLRARAWPAGEATVHVSIEALGPERSRIHLREDAVAGPAKLLPQSVRQLSLIPRNTESLRRLALIAGGRHRVPAPRPDRR